MNTKEIATSTPNTIRENDNYLKDYVNTSGFQWNSSCLDVAFTNLGDDFSKYVQKVGDYNTVTATNPIYTDPVTYTQADYSGNCPEGWTTNPIWNWGGQTYAGCTNPTYNGAFNTAPCYAGRTQQISQKASCPPKNWGSPDSYQEGGYWYWDWIFPVWQSGYSVPNDNAYVGWNGPTDASQGDFSNTNIGSQSSGTGSYCTAGWSASNSQGGSQADCAASGGTWVNYYNDPTWGSHGYTCYKPNEMVWTTEPASYFWNNDDENKKNWENTCGATWPRKTITIPGFWTCTYGNNINDDIAKGNIFQVGTSSSIIEAAKIALKSNRMNDNFFFMIDNNIYIIGKNSDYTVITSKQSYQPNCTDQNNKMGTLYSISQEFYDMLNNCKVVNDSVNNVNISRNIVQNAVVGSIKENFTNLDNITDISKNQDEILKNLANNYNKKAELYNYQIDVIGQNEKIVETQNKKLNNQLNEMTAIQEQIALKDRVIELNDELSKKQIRNKKVLIGFFVLLPFLGIPLLLVVIKAISPSIGLSIAALIIVGYIIYILVVSNQSEIKKFGREETRIISKYEKALLNYWNKQKEKLGNSLSKFVNGKCSDSGNTQEEGEEEESGSGSGKNIAYPKGDYLMKSNGPFYYYDGSAPPQQIYPGAIGSINFSIEGENYKFPKEISENLEKIKNPITKFFFETWGMILDQNGIKMDDPRFNEVLDVIDFPDSDQTPMPFWDNIKLPIVTNVDQQFNYLFQSYNKEKKNLSKTASVLLIDLWNFVFGDKIPDDVYEIWVNKLANILKQSKTNIELFYNDYLVHIMRLPKFTEKYGSGKAGLAKFVEIKMIDFIKTFNPDISVSQPFAKRYVP